MEENKIKHQTSSLSRKIKRKGDGNKGDKKQRLCRDAEQSQAAWAGIAESGMDR